MARIRILTLTLPWSVQVSVNRLVSSEEDRLLLTLGTELYQCVDPDTLLPYLIKDLPSMPAVRHHRLNVDANTAGFCRFAHNEVLSVDWKVGRSASEDYFYSVT